MSIGNSKHDIQILCTVCYIHPDSLNDPVVRGMYLGTVQPRKKTRLNRSSQEENNRAVGLLHQKINNYNQSVAFLAEVIRNTVYHQREIYPKLHIYIQQVKGSVPPMDIGYCFIYLKV